jgi:hypothetical protein
VIAADISPTGRACPGTPTGRHPISRTQPGRVVRAAARDPIRTRRDERLVLADIRARSLVLARRQSQPACLEAVELLSRLPPPKERTETRPHHPVIPRGDDAIRYTYAGGYVLRGDAQRVLEEGDVWVLKAVTPVTPRFLEGPERAPVVVPAGVAIWAGPGQRLAEEDGPKGVLSERVGVNPCRSLGVSPWVANSA